MKFVIGKSYKHVFSGRVRPVIRTTSTTVSFGAIGKETHGYTTTSILAETFWKEIKQTKKHKTTYWK